MDNHLVLDFEFREVAGRIQVLCVVARHLESGRTWKEWLGGATPPGPSFPLGPDTTVVAHYAVAEARCLLELGREMPGGWIDTFVEERVLAKGTRLESGFGLLDCCRRRGIPVMADFQKSDMQALCAGKANHDEAERRRILDYCLKDVEATAELFREMRPEINESQALFRGAYIGECALMTHRGIPVDQDRFDALKNLGNEGLRELFAREFDDHGILSGGTLDMAKFSDLVETQGIDWPRTLVFGRYKTDDDTLKEMSRIHGEPWEGIRQLLKVLRSFKVDALVCRDGRLVADMRPFGTITGRCAPSTSAFLWNAPKWLRSLLQPPPGRSVLMLDWANQEFAVAAALSEDGVMMRASESGDPYLAFAKAARRVPVDATRETHPGIRDQFKVVSLGALMGMGEDGVAQCLETDTCRAQELLEAHRRTFPVFREWSNDVVSTAGANLPLETAFGLVYRPDGDFDPRTARNFPLQATGSDMLRVAVLLLAEKGVETIATVHDSVMLECDTRDAGEVERIATECLREASGIALWERLEIRTECTRVDHPFHHKDGKGHPVWARLSKILKLPLDEHGG